MTADSLAAIKEVEDAWAEAYKLANDKNLAAGPVFQAVVRAKAASAALVERLEQAEAALREIRWLHHDDGADYRQLFAEAQRIAAASIPKEET